MNKKCNTCLITKIIDLFDKNRSVCKKCRQLYKNSWAKNNRKENPDQQNSYYRNYYKNNKNKILSCVKHYKENNKEKIKNNNKIYYINNKDEICNKSSQYRKNNEKKVSKRIANWKRIQRKINPSFRIRENISRAINSYLKKNGSSKFGNSLLNNIKYSIQELKEHLEKQFEPWMSWGNYGKYNMKIWNDDNQSTWTWQIDHIIPQSILPYVSMRDNNFKKCWALNNLRPLSSKQNFIDGITRIRHNGII